MGYELTVGAQRNAVLDALNIFHATRADFQAWAATNTPSVGTIVDAGGYAYRFIGYVTSVIPDLPGWLPYGDAYPDHWKENTVPGVTGMGVAINTATAWFNALRGGLLRFKSTIYSADVPLEINGAVTWEGEGWSFNKDYTAADAIVTGAIIQAREGLNADLLTIRARTQDLAAGSFPRTHASIRKLCLSGNKSTSSAKGSFDRNTTGWCMRAQGVSYLTVEFVAFWRGASGGAISETYDYGGSVGSKGCNNFQWDNVFSLQHGGNAYYIFAGDSNFSNINAGACGGDGLVFNSAITQGSAWNCDGHGCIMAGSTEGFNHTALTIYDCGKTGVFASGGGDCGILNSTIKNNGRDTTQTAPNRSGILVSTSMRSLNLDGNVIIDTDVSSQQYAVAAPGAAVIKWGTNTLTGVVADTFLGDTTNMVMHAGAPQGIAHQGFTATGAIDLNSNIMRNVRALTRDFWANITSITSGTLVGGNNDTINLNITGGATVTDITTSLAGIPILTFRNVNTTSVNFVHNDAKLRLMGKANVELETNETITFMLASGSVWQQISGKTGGTSPYGILAADYTLTSTTASQRLFNWSATGALTLRTGFYEMRAQLYISGMDPTSGNAQFNALGAGTATINAPLSGWIGVDSTTPSAAAAQSGGHNISLTTGTNIVTASTGTALVATITGTFEVTAAGTIIPSISLFTAAAAIVNKGSSFRVTRLGSTNIIGPWA